MYSVQVDSTDENGLTPLHVAEYIYVHCTG